MPIPDFQSLMLPALKALSGGTEISLSTIRNRVADSERLSPEDLQELLPSGRQPVFANRVVGRCFTWTCWTVEKGSSRCLETDDGG